MRLPRLTTRRLMLIVAAVAVVLGTLVERSRRFQQISRAHIPYLKTYAGTQRFGKPMRWYDNDGTPITYQEVARRDWHSLMWSKYLRAARYPWLPVPPDPPEPK